MAQLEIAGISTAVLATTAFLKPAAEQWSALGFDRGSTVAVGHPIGSMPPEQVLAEAESAVERVIDALTAGTGASDAAFG